MLKAKNTIKSLHKTKNRLKQANCLFESKTNKTTTFCQHYNIANKHRPSVLPQPTD